MKPKTPLGLLVKIGGIIIVAAGGLLPFAAKAVSFDELYWSQPKWQAGRVLGNLVDSSPGISEVVRLTSLSNKSLQVTAVPLEFDAESGLWSYRLNWKRKNKTKGSIFVNKKMIGHEDGAVGPEGFIVASVPAGSRVKVEFYGKPAGKGSLLLRKYFTALKAPDMTVCSSPAAPEGCYYRGNVVKLLSPNGGEKWKLKTAQKIVWELGNSDPTDQVNIELVSEPKENCVNRDGAVSCYYLQASYYLLAKNTSNTGSFNWQAGLTDMGEYAPVGKYTVSVKTNYACTQLSPSLPCGFAIKSASVFTLEE